MLPVFDVGLVFTSWLCRDISQSIVEKPKGPNAKHKTNCKRQMLRIIIMTLFSKTLTISKVYRVCTYISAPQRESSILEPTDTLNVIMNTCSHKF